MNERDSMGRLIIEQKKVFNNDINYSARYKQKVVNDE